MKQNHNAERTPANTASLSAFARWLTAAMAGMQVEEARDVFHGAASSFAPLGTAHTTLRPIIRTAGMLLNALGPAEAERTAAWTSHCRRIFCACLINAKASHTIEDARPILKGALLACQDESGHLPVELEPLAGLVAAFKATGKTANSVAVRTPLGRHLANTSTVGFQLLWLDIEKRASQAPRYPFTLVADALCHARDLIEHNPLLSTEAYALSCIVEGFQLMEDSPALIATLDRPGETSEPVQASPFHIGAWLAFRTLWENAQQKVTGLRFFYHSLESELESILGLIAPNTALAHETRAIGLIIEGLRLMEDSPALQTLRDTPEPTPLAAAA